VTFIVFKLDHLGREVWQYPARVLSRDDSCIRLEAFFNRDDMDLGYTVFRRGDRFVETFYSDRWYNIFAVYDKDDGRLKGWYCNICRPAEISRDAVRCEDLVLDVWIEPDGSVLVLDEAQFDELELSIHERRAARQATEELMKLAKTGRLPD
jgi:uncharacterized protein